ncbi:hypothetical protein HMPREF1210_02007 [Paenisporosarcina sp. HGH0030]|uniref:hypothetical protein n=1 Tax=Paenisporosarcina sp. HGH0030 TaxID=1078085 RepID=UPI00034E62E3|nr:hypothetical protein [Paenisporosarcina sp. HGH0030]EPD51409.1 hypothetical protein HMPREF1210_02007 [Paenisporosarcina sp. HGH0030]
MIENTYETVLAIRTVNQLPEVDIHSLVSVERSRIDAGVLCVHSKAKEGYDSLIFDSTVLPTGIECSGDEILPFRKDAYSVSYEKRKKGE